MTKKEKINLIERFRAGDLTALETLRKEREQKKMIIKIFFPVFITWLTMEEYPQKVKAGIIRQ